MQKGSNVGSVAAHMMASIFRFSIPLGGGFCCVDVALLRQK